MIEIYAHLATVIVLTLTLIVLALTLWSSMRMLEVSTRPQVECYLRSRSNSPNVFELAVANFGKGAAKNLEVELVGVDEVDFEAHAIQLSWRHKGPFPLLGPGEYITNLFGFAPSLMGKDKEPLKPFKIRASYKWTSFWYWRIVDVVEYHDMDVEAFRGLVPEWPKNEVAEILKKELPNITKAVETRPRPRLPPNTGETITGGLGCLESLMPELFSEMRVDLKKHSLSREFIITRRSHIYAGGDNKQILAYYHEDHEELTDKMGVLVNSGAVIDITYTNVDRYVMSEALVTHLSGSDAA